MCYQTQILGSRQGKKCLRTAAARRLKPSSSSSRLASLLLRLAAEHGVPSGDGIVIKLPLTQRELATAAATSREVVARTLRTLRSRDVVRTSAHTRVEPFEIEPGDTIYFIVACGADPGYDSFTWAPHVSLREAKDAQTVKHEWAADTDFAPPPPPTLNPWERYAQALLMTNEFVFIY